MQQQYIISVSDIVRANGLSCPPDKVNITFEQPECADVVCVQNATTITISIPDGCDQKCFYGIASCDVECDTCGDMPVTICPCMDNTGCGPCSICDPVKHICISNCPPGTICSEQCGGCAECDSENPCSGDKVCQNCKCQCPPDKPYPGPNGSCLNCRDKNDCPPCHECTPTGCKPIVCETGVCNDQKGCVECNTKTDCQGANKCCEDNKCVCCPGFTKDQDGNCVKIDCVIDSDCSDCETCDIPTGKCKPTICPPGTVCVNDGCLPICDCDNPLCDTSNACIRLNDSTCYCSSCSGSCADGQPCGPGCYCDKKDDKCKPNPCKGPCNNGTDCGPGCGCNPITKQCEPCGSVPCGTPCSNLLGCGCPDGTNCTDLPDCGGDCSNGGDCPPGCGCHKGKCVNCKNFNCVDCAGVDGCKCTDGTNCESDPNRDCKDIAEFTKNESNCSLTAKFDIKAPCSCPVITAGVIPLNYSTGKGAVGGNNVPAGVLNTHLKTSIRLELRKGISSIDSFNNSPLLNDTNNPNILNNEMPNSGIITATSYAYYRKLTGELLPKIQIDQKSLSIANATLLNFEDIKIGTVIFTDRVMEKFDIEFEISSKLVFDSGCDYKVKPLFKLSEIVKENYSIGNVSAVNNLQTDSLRNPDIVWQKSKTNSFTKENIFRKVYVPKGQDGKYQDTLYGPGKIPAGNPYPLNTPEGELWNGYNYKVSSSCSCDEASIDNLAFCNADKLKYKFANNSCQTSIQITEDFTPCPINDEHSKFNIPGYTIPSDTETRFEIFFNNKLVYEFKGILKAGFNISYIETINTVTIVQYYGEKEVCRKNYSHPYTLPNPSIDFKCNDDSDNSVVKIIVNQESNDPKISNIKFGTNNTYFDQYEVNGVFTNSVTKKIDKNLFGNNNLFILYTFTNGCTKKVNLPKCNSEVIPEVVPSIYSYAQCTPIGPNPKIVVNAYGFTENVTYSLNGGTPQSSNEFFDIPAGNYIVTVTDGLQTQTANVTVENTIVPEIYLLDETICPGASTKLVIKADSGTQFTINTPNTTINAVTVGGIYELPIPYSPSAAGNYTVILASNNVKICPAYTKTLSLSLGGQQYNPTIDIEPGSYCIGNPIRFRILNGGSSVFSVSSNGTGSITTIVMAGNEYVGLYTPNVTNGQIAITGLLGDTCNTTTNPIVNVTTTQGPIIVGANAVCLPNNTVTITVNTSNATSVKIQNVDAIESSPGSGVWIRTNITGLTNATILVSNGNCTLNSEIEIPNCSCPSGTLLINNNGNLCGPGNAEFSYDNFVNQTPDSSWEYFWETQNFGTWVQVGLQQVFNPSSTPTLTYGITQNNSVIARLVLINTTNGCRYNSNESMVTSSSSLPVPTITMSPIPAIVGNIVKFTTQQGYSNYEWTINGNVVSGNTYEFTYTPSVAGSVTVSVTVTNASGCTATSQATNFNIGANCVDIPITYLPSSSCSDISVQVTNNVGVPINFTCTGTGSLGTVINQTGVVPITNIILIDADILDPSEQVTSLNFVFTYQQGANPVCTINKTLSLSYARCQYGYFELLQTGSVQLTTCSGANQNITTTTRFRTSCTPPAAINYYIEYIIDTGSTEVVIDTYSGVYSPIIPVPCNNGQNTTKAIAIPIVTYGGSTVTIKSRCYIGTNNTGTLLGIDTLGTIAIPASC